MSRKIISLGFIYPDDDVEQLAFVSDRSLLDADIIIAQPQLADGYGQTSQFFEGQPVLNETASFRVREAAAHWRRELDAAATEGKTIVVLMGKPTLVQLHTGQKRTSGTGRNQKVTNIVEAFTSYSALPLEFGEVVARGGTDIRVAGDLGPMRNYWSEFADVSPYQVYFELAELQVLLTTRTGKRPVGGVLRRGSGTIVLLPPPQFDSEELYDEDEDEEMTLSTAGRAVGARLTELLLGLDSELRASTDARVEPEWSHDTAYQSPAEAALRTRITELDKELERLSNDRRTIEAQIAQESQFKRLLFDSGKSLEEAVTQALRLLGFDAQHVSEGDSEFDVVFQSAEGRFLGEVEGKLNKPVNIDKLSQLERNLQEDFSRDDVNEYAIGVLFANTYLLTPPNERPPEYFTQKCLSGSTRGNIALVRTPDLFDAILAVKRGADANFVQGCRKAFLAGRGGLVRFPTP